MAEYAAPASVDLIGDPEDREVEIGATEPHTGESVHVATLTREAATELHRELGLALGLEA